MKLSDNWDKIEAVDRMQQYIVQHFQQEITLADLAKAAAYSPWQALRAFSELTGKTPFAYLRDVRLSDAAKKLRDTSMNVLDIALSETFGSHEGFTKAFSRKFGLQPSQYRKQTPPIPLFQYHPVSHYYRMVEGGSTNMNSNIVFTQVIERPERKLLLKRGVKATEYFAYCEEVGCDVWGELESMKGGLYESIGVWLPPSMRKPGTSEYCQGMEYPMDAEPAVPDGYDMMTLPACKYLVFQGEPYDDDQFMEAIDTVMNAIDRYDPARYGWAWAPESGPRFQLEPRGARGYIEARPVQERALVDL
ncbi:AraC family transcriptional regulator [Eubacteriales bacterium OttesenSCG-928-N13]|nr:AraC family transcriptional regulator [Eubacteriales bacterium OttesenSCG-928-N13]